MCATQARNKAIHIAGICGSLREASYARMALVLALRGAAKTKE
jgi:hypothetical protein